MASKQEDINKVFERAEAFIPPEILGPVRDFLFAARRKYNLNHEAFDDLMQTCLMKIWALESEFNRWPPVYFVGIARKTIFDSFRERAKWSRNTAKVKELFSINEKEMMNVVLRQVYSKGDFDRLITSVLNDEEAAVVILRFGEDLTLKQISVVLELSLATVKRRLSKAVHKLRSHVRRTASERQGENVEIYS